MLVTPGSERVNRTLFLVLRLSTYRKFNCIKVFFFDIQCHKPENWICFQTKEVSVHKKGTT